MKQILLAFGKVLQRSFLVMGLVSLLAFSGLLVLPEQPVYAAVDRDNVKALQREERKADLNYDKSLSSVNRQEAYEDAVKAAESPAGLEKAYERDLQAYEGEHSGQNLLGKAENAIEKVIGKD